MDYSDPGLVWQISTVWMFYFQFSFPFSEAANQCSLTWHKPNSFRWIKYGCKSNYVFDVEVLRRQNSTELLCQVTVHQRRDIFFYCKKILAHEVAQEGTCWMNQEGKTCWTGWVDNMVFSCLFIGEKEKSSFECFSFFARVCASGNQHWHPS